MLGLGVFVPNFADELIFLPEVVKQYWKAKVGWEDALRPDFDLLG